VIAGVGREVRVLRLGAPELRAQLQAAISVCSCAYQKLDLGAVARLVTASEGRGSIAAEPRWSVLNATGVDSVVAIIGGAPCQNDVRQQCVGASVVLGHSAVRIQISRLYG
jgi:hypothetical protein